MELRTTNWQKFAVSRVAAAILISTISPSYVDPPPVRAAGPTIQNVNQQAQMPPFLGADFIYADSPHVMIEALRDPVKGDEMAKAFRSAGLRSLRFSFHGFYSPLGPDASAKIKAENKMSNEFPWFPFDLFLDFIHRHDFTMVVALNVEEGPDVAELVLRKINDRRLRSKLVALELSNEPWLNHRPWLPEEYAGRAADIIERLAQRHLEEQLHFGLPLTVGTERNTPTKLSDNEWVTRMLREVSRRIELKKRTDILGVIHLYARGVHARTIQSFNKIVRPFMPSVRYLVTEFNIRSSLKDNPHLTNKYAMEFARRVTELMLQPDVVAMYVHGVPFHSVLYWANRRVATVVGLRDPKLSDTQPGWHLTPTGKVYALYSSLAWNGSIVGAGGSDEQRYWAVRSRGGDVVLTFLNDTNKRRNKRVKLNGIDTELRAEARSIICTNQQGTVLEMLSLQY